MLVIRMESNESLMNAIRRSIEEIPVLAVDEVEIFKNDSALYDEVLAHRVGLVPLKSEKKVNDKTEVELKLVKSGPGWVYSGDLKGAAEVIYKEMPLTLLEEGQEIEIVATARPGKGIDHAKYVPGMFYYRHLLQIKSGNNKIDEIVSKSNGVVKSEKKGSHWKADLTEAEVEEIERIDKEAIQDSDEMLVFIESFGQIESKEMLISAIAALDNNLEKLEKAL